MNIRFGLLLDHQFPRHENLADHLDQLIVVTERARDLGFDAIFGIHHFLANLQTPQPFQILARLIPHAGNMLLGTSVYVASLSHPVQIAEEVATLDQLSRGRVIFGAGIGYRDEEFASFGINRTERGPRFVEALEVIRGLWSESPFEYSGKYFTMNGVNSSVRPFRNSATPIWIGANTPKTIARAAEIGDAWIASPNVKLNWAGGNLEIFRDIRKQRGLATALDQYPIAREMHIANSDSEAIQRSSRYLQREYAEYARYDLNYFLDKYDDLVQKSFLIGSAETVTNKINQYVSAGFNFFIFRVFWSGMPYEMAINTLERFASDVMPKFREKD